MEQLTRILMLVLVGMSGAAALATSLHAEEGTVKVLAPWESEGQIYRVEPELLLFVGTNDGIMYIENGEGSLDAALFVCPSSREISLKDKTVEAKGRCIITTSDGDKVYAGYECKGAPGGCKGHFELKGGTGAMEGISGGGEMLVRTALSGLAADLESGSVVSGAAGLAVWPELKYKIPAAEQ